MRPTLLDLRSGGSSSWTPTVSPVRMTPHLSRQEGREFRQLVTSLVPCHNHDPELWFAEQGARIEQAKALCQECPLMARCLEGALARVEPWGVWGGEVIVDGTIVEHKRGRGRPRKVA